MGGWKLCRSEISETVERESSRREFIKNARTIIISKLVWLSRLRYSKNCNARLVVDVIRISPWPEHFSGQKICQMWRARGEGGKSAG